MLRIAFFVGFAVVAAATAEPPAAATELVQGFEPSEAATEEDFKEMSRLFTGGTCRCDSFRGNCEFGNMGGSFIGRNGCRKGYQPTCGGIFGICYCLCKSVPACTSNGQISQGKDCLCGSSGEETGQICEEGSRCDEFDTIGMCTLKACGGLDGTVPEGGDCSCGAGPIVGGVPTPPGVNCRSGSTCTPAGAAGVCTPPVCDHDGELGIGEDCVCGSIPCPGGSTCYGHRKTGGSGGAGVCIPPACKDGIVATRHCSCGSCAAGCTVVPSRPSFCPRGNTCYPSAGACLTP